MITKLLNKKLFLIGFIVIVAGFGFGTKAEASINLVQTITGTPNGGSTQAVATFSSNNTSGNTVVVVAIWFPTSGAVTLDSVTDSRNSYTIIPATLADRVGTHFSHMYTQIAYATNVGAGANTVTANFSASTGAIIYVYEISPSTLGQATTATGNSADPSVGPVTTETDGEFGVAVTGIDDGFGFGSGWFTAGSGWTLGHQSGGGNQDAADEYQTQSSQGSLTGNFVHVFAVAGPWAASMATFRTAPAGDTTKPVVTAFVIPSTASSLIVDVTTFTATDDSGTVTGYKLTESATPPLAGDAGWIASAPATYTFSSEGAKTLYAWVKDAAGNVSDSLNDSVTITLPPVVPQDIYIAQTAAGAANGSSCSNAYAVTFFNTSGNWANPKATGKIGPGDTVHLCGTITSVITAQGSGSSGDVITILFENNAKISQPVCPYTGCLVLDNRSYITINGGTNGILENTANGSSLANQESSYGISGASSSYITVQNLTIQNLYVQVAGNSTLGDASIVRCISWSGSNWTITNNTFHDVGWCLTDFYGNGDTNTTISNNNFYNYGHGVTLATTGANSFSGFYLSNNHFGATANWSDSGCSYHDDGFHTFGTSGSSMSDIYVYNNLFDGDWGTCPTGYIFVEGGSGPGSTPSNMSNSYWWNNVGIVDPASPIVNTNGWFTIAGITGITKILNNTIIGPNATDNTNCLGIGAGNLTLKNNVISNCGNPISINGATILAGDANYNFYGPSCQNLNNCFTWNGSFTGSFANWKTTSGIDANSIQNNTTLLTSNGVPQASSPVIGVGPNLTSLAIGSLAALSNDTGLGNSRTPIARPAGSTAWDMGAYQYTVAPDTTVPTPGNSGAVTTASVTTNSLTLNWTKATDDTSAQSSLVYRVYRSSSNNINSVANIFANGTAVSASTTDIATIDVSSLSPSTTYYFNVVVADEAGNSAVYTTKSETTLALSSTKAISVFDFNGLTPAVVGTINETDKTIALAVPYGTAVTALIPTITHTGASISPASGVAGNFTTSQIYTVTAANASTVDYTVTVTVGSAPVVTQTGGGNGPISGSMGGRRQDISKLLASTTPVISTSTPVKYNFTRNLSLHTTGTDVKNLQKLLNSLGFTISKTGAGSPGNETTLFGSLTYKALQKFQKSIGLPATGFFGPMTREYLRTH